MRDVFGNQVTTGIWGNRISKKQLKREVLEENIRRGRAGEESVSFDYSLRGYEVERTGKGHDFRVRRRDMLTGRVVESRTVEVKTGNAKLSPLQSRTKRKQGNYKVERVNSSFW